MNKLINSFKENKQTLAELFQIYLIGILGGLTVFAVVYAFYPSPPAIRTVNITGLVDRFIEQESAKKLSQKDMKREVKQFGDRLETELQHLAKTQHVVLLPSEAVVAGTQDWTGRLRARLQHRYGKGH